ncbi:E3 ubiquitin-protein ligase TRIM71 [Geodia barretti]|uniref:E3 ubiquitin-protein ligase TRIM71 n=1 Tax=Geodia barretti TaxID=519541 RepID=A0AA35S128_GEOBA|nr:E3 ubiquitin-protein ligase TRIM71 [Geodia barretti]
MCLFPSHNLASFGVIVQNLGHILQDLVKESAGHQLSVWTKEKELVEIQERLKAKDELLQWSEKEKQTMREQLTVKEAEFRRAEETVMQEQQRVLEMKQQEAERVQAKEEELAHTQQQLNEKEDQLKSSEALVANLQHQLQQAKILAPYIIKASGPGLVSATVNQAAHILVELSDYSGRPYSLHQNITATLEHVYEATPTSSKRWLWSKKPHGNNVVVVTASPFQYDVTYTAAKQGKHTLRVKVDNKDIDNSPFDVMVYAHPSQLGQPKKVVAGLSTPYGITFNKQEEMIVSEMVSHRISVFDRRGQKVRVFGSRGDAPHQMKYPRGLAIDDADNIYVTSEHRLQKFTTGGELLKCIGQRGKKEGEFDDPRGVTVRNNNVYVCDCDNHRIQVFSINLNFIRSIGSRGNGVGEFDAPDGLKFDTDGNMYVTESGNERVQVLDSTGKFLREFGREGKGKLGSPSGLHIADKYVYVCDHGDDRIVVYEASGHFVTSFGKRGVKEGELYEPRCITSCANGFISVCDFTNNRVQIF